MSVCVSLMLVLLYMYMQNHDLELLKFVCGENILFLTLKMALALQSMNSTA
jgi:hypothetical protein